MPTTRRRLPGLLALLLICSAGAASVVAQQPATTESAKDELLASLDLSRPDLLDVKQALDKTDIAGARRALADYLRTRKNVHWHFDPSSPPARLSDKEKQEADDAIRHTFTS